MALRSQSNKNLVSVKQKFGLGLNLEGGTPDSNIHTDRLNLKGGTPDGKGHTNGQTKTHAALYC